MSKLLNDNIELIVDVNGTKVEQEYHSISKSTDELIRKQKELRVIGNFASSIFGKVKSPT